MRLGARQGTGGSIILVLVPNSFRFRHGWISGCGYIPGVGARLQRVSGGRRLKNAVSVRRLGPGFRAVGGSGRREEEEDEDEEAAEDREREREVRRMRNRGPEGKAVGGPIGASP